MAGIIKFSNGNGNVVIEDPFMIEIIYKILKGQFGDLLYINEKLTFSEDKNGFDKFESFYCEFRSIIGGLELILKNLGERIVPIFAVEYYYEFNDGLLDDLCFLLVLNYGSTKQELIDSCWKLLSDFFDLYMNLRLISSDNEPVIFHNIKFIIEFYKK